MNLFRTCRPPATSARKQSGAVLFFVLIALVVLLLAGSALIRTVDTATIISGNLVFKQAATSSADIGVEKAIKWLSEQKPLPSSNDASNGYYHYINESTPKDYFTDSTWSSSVSAGDADSSGNTSRYIIERLCREPLPGTTDEENCLFGPSVPGGFTHGNVREIPTVNGKTPVFRITVKTTGPRNSSSYVQAFVY